MDVYKFELDAVQFPANIEEKLENERQQSIRNFIIRGGKPEDAEKAYPKEAWVPLQATKEGIEGACNSFLNTKYFSKERNNVMVPAEERKLKGRVAFKLAASEGELSLTKSELEFVLKALNSDLPPAEVFVYVGDFLEAEKVKQEQGGSSK